MARLTVSPGRLGSARNRIAFTSSARAVRPDRPAAPWRRWYGTAAWRSLRLEVFARDLFTCAMCKVIEADTSKLVCDHREPHRGDATKFWDKANLQTLCKSPCHDKHKQQLEQATRHQIGVWD